MQTQGKHENVSAQPVQRDTHQKRHRKISRAYPLCCLRGRGFLISQIGSSLVRAATSKSAFLALSIGLVAASAVEIANELPDGHTATGVDVGLPSERSSTLCPVLHSIGDVGGVAQMSIPDGMDFPNFGLQYWGDSFRRDALESAPHGALIIEPALVGADASPLCREESFFPSEIMAIRRKGTRPVFGYLNVGELVHYRDYWVEAFGSDCTLPDQPSDSANKPVSAWPAWYGTYNRQNELLSAFWTPEWEDILRRRIDALLAAGFDGVFLDDVLHYFYWGKDESLVHESLVRGGPATIVESAQAMIALIVRLGRYARFEASNARPEFKLIVNGAPYIGWDAIDPVIPADSAQLDFFRCYFNAIDAILVENALSRTNDNGLLDFLRNEYVERGKPVLTVESWTDDESSDIEFERFRVVMHDKAEENGFLTYVVANGLFDRLYPPVSQEMPANEPARAK